MKSYFVEDYIDLRLPKTGVIRTTLTELHYYSEILNELIVVPVGFDTDLGSIPSRLQWLFPKDGKAVLGYVLHDYLYKTGIHRPQGINDDILEEAMEVLDVKWWRRKGVRAGLWAGGWYAWNEHRNNDKDLV